MNRKVNIGHRMKDLLDENSFEVLEKMGFRFFCDRRTGKRLRIIKHRWQR